MQPLHHPTLPFSTPLIHTQIPATALPLPSERMTPPYSHTHPGLYKGLSSSTALPTQSQIEPFSDPYQALCALFTSAENQAYAFTAPQTPFGTLGSLLLRLEPVHTLVPPFTKVLEYRLYRLDKTCTQIYGSDGKRID